MYFRTRVQLPAPPPFSSEGLRPSDCPTRALARRFALAPIAWLVRCARSRRIFQPTVVHVRRLHDSSTRLRTVEQPDRCVQCRRTEVHVALSRPEILVAGELLNRPCWPPRIARCEQNV